MDESALNLQAAHVSAVIARTSLSDIREMKRGREGERKREGDRERHKEKPERDRERWSDKRRDEEYTSRILHRSDSQSWSSQGWNIPRVTQFNKITSMEARSNHVEDRELRNTMERCQNHTQPYIKYKRHRNQSMHFGLCINQDPHQLLPRQQLHFQESKQE